MDEKRRQVLKGIGGLLASFGLAGALPAATESAFGSGFSVLQSSEATSADGLTLSQTFSRTMTFTFTYKTRTLTASATESGTVTLSIDDPDGTGNASLLDASQHYLNLGL
jgi:hypothetical protein